MLKIPRRKPGMIPCVFPWSDNWGSVHLEWQRRKQETPGESDNRISPPIDESKQVDEGLGSDSPSSAESNDAAHDQIPEDSGPSINIETLIKTDFNLPKDWMREVHHTVHGPVLSFFLTRLIETRDNSEKSIFKTVIWKEIIIKTDLVPELHVLGQQYKGASSPSVPIEAIEDIQEFITTMDQLNVCRGSLLQNDLTESNCKIVHKDIRGIWCHNKCSLLVDPRNKEQICIFCCRIKRTVKQKLRRMTASGRDMKRIHIVISPKRKIALTKLREKLGTAKKATTRANLKISELGKELEDLRIKLQGCEASVISEHLQNGKITANTATALKEILSDAKRKGPQGRRYSEDWILLCMLLHMRSPTGYRFIHENGILPVPDVRTLRKYLAAIPASCGFDPKFFEVLKTTLAKRDPKDRHGVILIDEMATRESLGVNAGTLTMTGLIDFGEEGPKSTQFTERANHGLVLDVPAIDDVLCTAYRGFRVSWTSLGSGSLPISTKGNRIDGKCWS